MGRIQGCTVSWISSQELTPQRSVAHQEPHIRGSTEPTASKSLLFNKSESATEHGKWVEMYVMSRLLGIMGLSGKFGCLCGKWKIIGWFSASSNGGIEVSQLFCSFCRFYQFFSTRVYGFHYMGSSSSALKKCNGHSLFGGVQWPWGTIRLFYKSLDLLCFGGRKETSNFFFLFSKQTKPSEHLLSFK